MLRSCAGEFTPAMHRTQFHALLGEGFRVRSGNILTDEHTAPEHLRVDCDMEAADQAVLTGRASPPEVLASDQALARRIAAGDVGAWDRFFERFFAWAYRFAYHHLDANHADAEDLCSDILMTAARHIKRFDASRGTLDLWLLGIARHRLARFCRARRTQVPHLPQVDSSHNPELILNTETDAALTRVLVNRALASLPQRQAAVLIGKYVAGHTVEELARLAACTPKAVESLLSRARARFRAAFAALLGGATGGGNHE